MMEEFEAMHSRLKQGDNSNHLGQSIFSNCPTRQKAQAIANDAPDVPDVRCHEQPTGAARRRTRDAHTVPTIIDSLKAYGRGLDVIALMHTPDGNEMNFPMTDNTTQEGEMLADEGTNITTEDPNAITSTMLNTKRFSSKFVPVSNTLLQDAIYDIIGHTLMQCGRRLGRGISRKVVSAVHATDGIDGITSVGTEVELSSNTTLAFVDDLIKLMHSIDRGYLSSEGGLGSRRCRQGLA